MNKKIVIIILAIVSLLSVIVIGAFGVVAKDFKRTIKVNNITFKKDYQNTDVAKFTETDIGYQIELTFQKTDSKTFQLEWTVNPQDASNSEVYFTNDKSEQNILTISETGLITFKDDWYGNCTISIITRDGDKTDTLTFVLINPDEGKVDPFNPNPGEFN